jgi:hypothetical protein
MDSNLYYFPKPHSRIELGRRKKQNLLHVTKLPLANKSKTNPMVYETVLERACRAVDEAEAERFQQIDKLS